ncbi:MAG: hypothetical protein PHW60_15300 [Kiritimatiellae bacterium]|nr:hypothetical protein [Kiritimatiellia bacterium]
MESCFVILPKMVKAESDGAMLLQAKKLVSWESAKPIVAFVGSDFLRERVAAFMPKAVAALLLLGFFPCL